MPRWSLSLSCGGWCGCGGDLGIHGHAGNCGRLGLILRLKPRGRCYFSWERDETGFFGGFVDEAKDRPRNTPFIDGVHRPPGERHEHGRSAEGPQVHEEQASEDATGDEEDLAESAHEQLDAH